MAKSRSLGTTSSLSGAALDDAKKSLVSISNSKTISTINKALGSSADLHLVGGTVRDVLLGAKQCDLDVATILKAEEVIEKLKGSDVKVIATGVTHGTVTAVVDTVPVEITTFRKPSAREESLFSKTIQEDLHGRDFTINAIAFSIAKSEIIDPLGGLADLQNAILKSVGKAEDRFSEDPLRILRMIRFGQAAGRKVDSNMLLAVKSSKVLLKRISIERIRSEFEKILMSSRVKDGLRALAQLELLEFILPELIESIGFEQNRFHTQDVFEHTLTVVENSPLDLKLRLAAVFHDIGKPQSLSVDEKGDRHFYLHEEIGCKIAKSAMKRLRFSNEYIDDVSQLVKLHMRPMDCGPSGVRRLIRDLGPLFDDWKKLKGADAPPVMGREEYEERLANFESLVSSETERLAKIGRRLLTVTGEDLIALGIPAGPGLGKIIKELENMVLENPDLNTKEILLENAKRLMKA